MKPLVYAHPSSESFSDSWDACRGLQSKSFAITDTRQGPPSFHSQVFADVHAHPGSESRSDSWKPRRGLYQREYLDHANGVWMLDQNPNAVPPQAWDPRAVPSSDLGVLQHSSKPPFDIRQRQPVLPPPTQPNQLSMQTLHLHDHISASGSASLGNDPSVTRPCESKTLYKSCLARYFKPRQKSVTRSCVSVTSN